MCNPQAAMAGASAVGSVMEHNEKVSAYNDTVDANNRTRTSAIDSSQLQISQTRLKEEQQQGNILEQKFDNLIKGIETRETLKTAALEDNIVGRSVTLALNDAVADRLRNETRMEQQSKFFSQQSDIDAKGIQAQLDGRLAQIVDPAPPDMMTAIIKGGANAASAGSSMKDTTWGDIVGA
jgi:hypothetical protein